MAAEPPSSSGAGDDRTKRLGGSHVFEHGWAKIGAVFNVLWGLLHYRAAYGLYQLAQSTPLTTEHGRLEQLAFYLAAFATAGIVLAPLNWRNNRLRFWVQRSSHRHRRYSLHLVRISAWLHASVAGDPWSGSVDRRLGLHRNRSGADVRRNRKDRWGETSNVKRGATLSRTAPLFAPRDTFLRSLRNGPGSQDGRLRPIARR
jgi:hypothetical protein